MFTVPEMLVNYMLIHKCDVDVAAQGVYLEEGIQATTTDRAHAVASMLRILGSSFG